MNFNVAAPRMLWLLLLILPPLVLFLVWAWRKRQQLITQFISHRLLAQLMVGVSPARQKARIALVVAAVFCLILALARPQWGFVWEEAKQRGLDIIVAIDTSNSMLAEDAPPNRLTRAKLAAVDLMRRAKTDRMGLIAFAGDAFMQCPLTLDDAAFSQSVDGLDTRTISQGGTALAEAIDTAVKAFKDEGENHKVLVIFTDGEDHEGEAVKSAEQAAKEGMRIFTIGIGSPEGEQLRVRDERGRVDYIRDDQGNPVKSQLNETLLQDIAKAAGGFYLPLRGTKTMDSLYEQGLAPLPKATNSSKLLRRFNERFHWPLACAILLLLVEMFLPEGKARRSKAAVSTSAPAGAAAEIVALLFLVLLPAAAWGGPTRALREYEAGKYEDALKDYQQLLDQKKDDPRLHFNAGAAAYQSRRLDEATKQFNQALSAPDLQLQQRAYYNLGNTYYRLGEQPPPNANPAVPPTGEDPRMKAWEQAVQNFDSALKLNPEDQDAKFNRSFVQKQLEELKKQQQKQQQQNKDNKDKKDDKQKQDQENQQKDDSQKDDKKDQQQQQQKDSQGQDKKDDQKEQQSKPDDKKEDKKSGKQSKPDKPEKPDQGAQKQPGEPDDKSKEEAEKEAAMMAAGQMTPQQAKQLLDAQKGEDEVLRLPQPNKPSNRNRSFKNW